MPMIKKLAVLFVCVMLCASLMWGQGFLSPINTQFNAATTVTPFNLLPSALQNVTETFSACCTQFTQYQSGGSLSVSGGVATITATGTNSYEQAVETASATYTFPALFSSIEITQNGSSTLTDDGLCLGITYTGAPGFYVQGCVDVALNIVFVQTSYSGSPTTYASTSFSIPSAPWYFGFADNQNFVSLWKCTASCGSNGSGWSQILLTGGADAYGNANVISTYNFFPSGNLANQGAYFGIYSAATATWKVANFNAGYFGYSGLHDLVLVTNEDGSPYVQSGTQVTFTASTVGPGGVSSCGVFTWDVVSHTLTEVGLLGVLRSGSIFPDQFAHIIYYGGGERKIWMSTTGNPYGGAIQVEYADLTSGPDILSGTNVISTMSNITLPGQTGCTGTGCGADDSMAFYDTANSRWEIAYTVLTDTSYLGGGSLIPTAAYSANLTSGGTWTLIFSDTGVSAYDHTVTIKSGSTYYIGANGPIAGSLSSRIYTQDGTYLGPLHATFSNSSVYGNPPPMVFLIRNIYYMITNDGTISSQLANPTGSASFQWGNFWQETAQAGISRHQLIQK